MIRLKEEREGKADEALAPNGQQRVCFAISWLKPWSRGENPNWKKKLNATKSTCTGKAAPSFLLSLAVVI